MELLTGVLSTTSPSLGSSTGGSGVGGGGGSSVSYALAAALSSAAGNATPISLRSQQVQAVISMLQFNTGPTTTSTTGTITSSLTTNDPLNDPVWKVLVYDSFGQDIISPLLKVNELREHGVTVHL